MELKALEDFKYSRDEICEQNISAFFYGSYLNSEDLEVLDFSDYIWPRDFEKIMENVRRFGIKEFTYSASSTGAMENIKMFTDAGCEIVEVLTLKKSYGDRPAIKFRVGK